MKDTVINGEQAIDMITKKKCSICEEGYKLIFMDLNMPVMNGF